MKSSDMLLYALVVMAIWLMAAPKKSSFCGGCAMAG